MTTQTYQDILPNHQLPKSPGTHFILSKAQPSVSTIAKTWGSQCQPKRQQGEHSSKLGRQERKQRLDYSRNTNQISGTCKTTIADGGTPKLAQCQLGPRRVEEESTSKLEPAIADVVCFDQSNLHPRRPQCCFLDAVGLFNQLLHRHGTSHSELAPCLPGRSGDVELARIVGCVLSKYIRREQVEFRIVFERHIARTTAVSEHYQVVVDPVAGHGRFGRCFHSWCRACWCWCWYWCNRWWWWWRRWRRRRSLPRRRPWRRCRSWWCSWHPNMICGHRSRCWRRRTIRHTVHTRHSRLRRHDKPPCSAARWEACGSWRWQKRVWRWECGTGWFSLVGGSSIFGEVAVGSLTHQSWLRCRSWRWKRKHEWKSHCQPLNS